MKTLKKNKIYTPDINVVYKEMKTIRKNKHFLLDK